MVGSFAQSTAPEYASSTSISLQKMTVFGQIQPQGLCSLFFFPFPKTFPIAAYAHKETSAWFQQLWKTQALERMLGRILLGCSQLISFCFRLLFALYLPLHIITSILDANTVGHEVFMRQCDGNGPVHILLERQHQQALVSHHIPPVDQDGQTLLYPAA